MSRYLRLDNKLSRLVPRPETCMCQLRLEARQVGDGSLALVMGFTHINHIFGLVQKKSILCILQIIYISILTIFSTMFENPFSPVLVPNKLNPAAYIRRDQRSTNTIAVHLLENYKISLSCIPTL